MKKRIFYVGVFLGMIAAVFLFGPIIGQSIYRAITPQSDIDSWKSKFKDLDNSFPRTATNEIERVKILRELAQRGIYIDRGIRDEAIEHNISPYSIFVMRCWHWQDFLGLQ